MLINKTQAGKCPFGFGSTDEEKTVDAAVNTADQIEAALADLDDVKAEPLRNL